MTGDEEIDSAPLLASVLPRLADGTTLSERETEEVFLEILDGRADDVQIAALLMALRLRGETVDEVVGASRALRSRMRAISAPRGAIDVCGTGGDGKSSLNISTAAAFVAAATGVPVAKHGSRAASSRSGASDVLTALGVRLDCPIPALERALAEVGHVFLMAPNHHEAMRHVVPVRTRLKMRTFFNFIGPLSNPAGVRRQLVGCFSPEWPEALAQALGRLGSEAAWVVHGAGGYDELTLFGPNRVSALEGGAVETRMLDPKEAGLSADDESALNGGDARHNAAAMESIFKGARGRLAIYADTVALNAAAALVIAGAADSLRSGLEQAQEALGSGAAGRKLSEYVRFTQAHAPKPGPPDAG